MDKIEFMSGRKIRRMHEREEAMSGLESIGYAKRKLDARDRLQAGLSKTLEAREKVIDGAARVQGILGRYAERANMAKKRMKWY